MAKEQKNCDYIKVLEKNLFESVVKLELSDDFIIQQDNDLKPCLKENKEFLIKTSLRSFLATSKLIQTLLNILRLS